MKGISQDTTKLNSDVEYLSPVYRALKGPLPGKWSVTTFALFLNSRLLEIDSDPLIKEKIQSKVIPLKKLLKDNNLDYSNFKINFTVIVNRFNELIFHGEFYFFLL